MNKTVLYTNDEFKKEYDKNFNFAAIKADDLSLDYFENVLIMPYKNSFKDGVELLPHFGGVFDENFDLIEQSVQTYSNFLGGSKGEIKKAYGRIDDDLKESPRDYIDEEVVFIGKAYGIYQYGHFLLETLSRLWFFLDGDQEVNSKYKICYISGENPNDEPSECFFELFELFGLKKEQFVRIDRPTSCKKVIIPEQSFRLSDYAHKKYLEVINKIKENVTAAKYEKIYFSRSRHTGAAQTFGEKQIENVFKKNGYKVFYPERLGIKDQISLLKGCKKFAGVAGTALHNALFAEDGIECIYINRSMDVCSPQLLIDKLKSFNIYFVDSYLSILPVYFCCNPYLLGLNENLEKFFQDFKFKYKSKYFYKDFSANVTKFLELWAYENGNRKFISGQISADEIILNLNKIFATYPIKRVTPQKNILEKIIDKLT